MTTLTDIEQLTDRYAELRRNLADTVADLQTVLEQAKRDYVGIIRREVAAVAEAHAELHTAIDAAPELFDKPKTRTFAGTKVGYRKQPGKINISDEEKTLKLIRKVFPEEQAELLIRRTESVDKEVLATLNVADLRRIAVTIIDDTDVIVIKPVDSEVDKLVNALLADAERYEEAAAWAP